MASNPYVNKVGLANGTTLIDLSTDTATQADVAQGKYFHLPTGERVQGTATGGGTGGTITQDQDGYLVLDDEAPSPTPSGGLEYETGTWTPSEDTDDAWISFANTHTTAPTIYHLYDTTGLYDATTYTNYRVSYVNLEQLFGATLRPSSSQTHYGYADYQYRSTSTSSLSTGTTNITRSISETDDTATTYPRYWAKETGIRATSSNTSRYWRAGKTYKWIAIWAPTT